MTNQYPGQCGTCGQRVEAGAGDVRKVGGRWTPFHAAGTCPPVVEHTAECRAGECQHVPQYEPAAAPAATVRANRHPGKCAGCGMWIEAGDGSLVKDGGRWAVRHVGDCPERATVGIYRDGGGVIWNVRESRGQKEIPEADRRRYAKRLVERPAGRLNEAGDSVRFDWEYEDGALYRLTEDMRVPLDDEHLRALMIATGKCIVCDHPVWSEETMRRGKEDGVLVGPVCRKSFAPSRYAVAAAHEDDSAAQWADVRAGDEHLAATES